MIRRRGSSTVPPCTRRSAAVRSYAAFTYDGTSHGNGAFGTPIVNQTAGSWFGVELPSSVPITFTKEGTFHYYCLIHGAFMSGDIVVEPASG